VQVVDTIAEWRRALDLNDHKLTFYRADDETSPTGGNRAPSMAGSVVTEGTVA
jgi:hypothetical protein